MTCQYNVWNQDNKGSWLSIGCICLNPHRCTLRNDVVMPSGVCQPPAGTPLTAQEGRLSPESNLVGLLLAMVLLVYFDGFLQEGFLLLVVGKGIGNLLCRCLAHVFVHVAQALLNACIPVSELVNQVLPFLDKGLRFRAGGILSC